VSLVGDGKEVAVVMDSHDDVVGSEAVVEELGKKLREQKGLRGGVDPPPLRLRLRAACQRVDRIAISQVVIFSEGVLRISMSEYCWRSCTPRHANFVLIP